MEKLFLVIETLKRSINGHGCPTLSGFSWSDVLSIGQNSILFLNADHIAHS